MGKRKIRECRAIFRIRYAPGTLTAVAYDGDGHELSRSKPCSASGKISIVVMPEVSRAKDGKIVYVP